MLKLFYHLNDEHTFEKALYHLSMVDLDVCCTTTLPSVGAVHEKDQPGHELLEFYLLVLKKVPRRFERKPIG